MEDCSIQATETVSDTNLMYNDVGKLILEELKSFRREMREEVRRLNANVQNFLFSKADIVNALLGDLDLFTDIEKTFNEIPFRKASNAAPSLPKLQKIVNNQKKVMHHSTTADNQKRMVIQPTTVEVVKTEPCEFSVNSNTTLISDDPSMVTMIVDPTSTYEKSASSTTTTTSVRDKKAIVLSDYSVSKSQEDDLKMVEVQIGQHNGQSSTTDDDSLANLSAFNEVLPQDYTATMTMSKLASLGKEPSSESDASLQRKPLLLPHHASPKLPSKHVLYSGKFKNYHGYDKLSYTEKKLLSRWKHKCQFCDRQFLSSNDLKRHIRVHTGDRPFQCHICSKAYTRNDHLRRHIKQKHTSEQHESKADTNPDAMSNT